MDPRSPLFWEILIAAALGVAVLGFLAPRRAKLFRPKEIGFGWTPNVWQGWVITFALAFAFAGVVVLVRKPWGG